MERSLVSAKCLKQYCRSRKKGLREKSEAFVLKPHLSGKSDMWTNFSLVFEKRHDVHDSASCDFLRFMDRPAGRVGSGRVGSKNCAN